MVDQPEEDKMMGTDQESLVVEYMVLCEGTDPFCDSLAAFNSFLSANSRITIANDNLQHDELTVAYTASMGTVAKNQRFFHLRFVCNESDRVREFESLLHNIRKMVTENMRGTLRILWDDIGFHYASSLSERESRLPLH